MTISDQAFFDKSVRHLRRQGSKAASGSLCAYYLPGGMRCAIGGAIPLAVAKRLGSQQIPANMLPKYARPFLPPSLALVGDLQDIHDTDNVCEWERKWSAVADDRGLKMPAKSRVKNVAKRVKARTVKK